MRVAIAVATYARPEGLRRLLAGIGDLVFEHVPPRALEVVVVDNSPDRSAEPVCAAAARALRWPLHYEHEPVQGIAQARNRAVARVRGRADFLAFIDDDEVPGERWLDALLAAQARFGADVVAGPVLPRFLEPVPAWIVAGGFFERHRFQTGTTLRHTGTCNVLIRCELFQRLPAGFDERFGRTGGEDTHFFLRAGAAGAHIVWADDAVVYEWHPASRTRAAWLLRRAFRVGNTWSLCERDLDGSASRRAARVLKALGRITQGTVSLPLALVLGRPSAVRSLQHIASGAGALSGVAGFHYEEYRTPHGH
jgi:GT2 family glycosyltransferase